MLAKAMRAEVAAALEAPAPASAALLLFRIFHRKSGLCVS
jgi:hypothetical protein